MRMPEIGFKPVLTCTGSKGLYARWDGLPPRCPKKGEYFLSGAIPVAYKAPNDLSTEYFIAIPLMTMGKLK